MSNNQNPNWNLVIRIPYSEPTINDVLLIQIFDENKIHSDKIIGSN